MKTSPFPIHTPPPAPIRFALVLGALVFSALAASAQSYAIDRFTINGGGGTSTGSVYAISGTVGQPAAGELSGGSYALQGGFWSLVAAIQTAGAPYLSVTRILQSVVVSWPAPASGWILETTPTLAGPQPPWVPVTTAYQTNANVISLTVPAPTGNRFYRLKKP